MEKRYEELDRALAKHKNAEKAAAMAAYMKNKFVFHGIPKPVRAAAQKPFMLSHKSAEYGQILQVAAELWLRTEREYQYIALDLLALHKRKAGPGDLPLLEDFITAKSWWDTVDTLAAHAVGSCLASFPNDAAPRARQWIVSDNMWLRRTAILFQLGYGPRTNIALLEELVLAEAGSKEFFIQKAIGWALRQYARTDPERVRAFATEAPLKPLSRREALKWL